jgi:phosphate transport system ATP-binding protein
MTTNPKIKTIDNARIQKQQNKSIINNNSTLKNQSTNKANIVYSTTNLDLWYGENHALKNINLDIEENTVTAIIGPSGCGKSTYIKTLNRMVELTPGVKTAGKIFYRDENIFDARVFC